MYAILFSIIHLPCVVQRDSLRLCVAKRFTVVLVVWLPHVSMVAVLSASVIFPSPFRRPFVFFRRAVSSSLFFSPPPLCMFLRFSLSAHPDCWIVPCLARSEVYFVSHVLGFFHPVFSHPDFSLAVICISCFLFVPLLASLLSIPFWLLFFSFLARTDFLFVPFYNHGVGLVAPLKIKKTNLVPSSARRIYLSHPAAILPVPYFAPPPFLFFSPFPFLLARLSSYPVVFWSLSVLGPVCFRITVIFIWLFWHVPCFGVPFFLPSGCIPSTSLPCVFRPVVCPCHCLLAFRCGFARPVVCSSPVLLLVLVAFFYCPTLCPSSFVLDLLMFAMCFAAFFFFSPLGLLRYPCFVRPVSYPSRCFTRPTFHFFSLPVFCLSR